MTRTFLRFELRCPKCDKLLGYAGKPAAATAGSLSMWCRRCKVAVAPVVRDTMSR